MSNRDFDTDHDKSCQSGDQEAFDGHLFYARADHHDLLPPLPPPRAATRNDFDEYYANLGCDQSDEDSLEHHDNDEYDSQYDDGDDDGDYSNDDDDDYTENQPPVSYVERYYAEKRQRLAGETPDYSSWLASAHRLSPVPEEDESGNLRHDESSRPQNVEHASAHGDENSFEGLEICSDSVDEDFLHDFSFKEDDFSFQAPEEGEYDSSFYQFGDDDDDEGPDIVVQGWDVECLRCDIEDIDFDFVYALHTFKATVEGQANAAKGEPMMLLDDSNSYWWLVRIVKDSTIGYLPAEHIETPTERLARLNKHRNLDLSAAMLGDQPEPTRSKAGFTSNILRRRKTVAFAAPTFVDYEKEYSDTEDEEDEAEALFAQQRADAKKQREEKEAEQQQQQEEAAASSGAKEDMDDESAKVKPLSTKPLATKPLSSRPQMGARKESTLDEIAEGSGAEEEEAEEAAALSLGEKGDSVSRSRNGTVRNTDSFFKDDTVETKKITLTPNLLRDDNAARGSTESGPRQRPSLDKLEKELSPDKKDDKKKKDKKEKDKKAGGLRGFFSRKDKKKSVDEDEESLGKRSMDTTDSRERDGEMTSPTPEGWSTPQRTSNGTKLQKLAMSDTDSPSTSTPKYVSEGPRNDVSNVPPASIRIIDPEQQVAAIQKSNNRLSMALQMDRSAPPTIAAPQPDLSSVPMQTNAAKSRMELDDSDSADEDEFMIQNSESLSESNMMDASAQPAPLSTPTKTSHLNDLAGEVSPITPTGPPALMADSASQDGQSISPSPSPEIMSTENSLSTRQTSTMESTTSVSRSSAGSASSTWNDEKLRMFFDSNSDVRDMLVMVYDKSDVVPAGPEHPIAGPLFREQNAKLAEITTQLDHMLGDWLARKQRLRGAI
ncbi:hypothetical protein TD95_003768 [Thielaviopsis punctulata]|uniref:SH3 domain-containing protein n=1 Tax=Thielaviopsis punctulata TaxID=72032 RepID=A0A0F4ZK95_9PEZI|nr:hypothetical protein TD95_003768 [Thielaviopsis punctulata]